MGTLGIYIGGSMERLSEWGGFASVKVQIYIEEVCCFDINLCGDFEFKVSEKFVEILLHS